MAKKNDVVIPDEVLVNKIYVIHEKKAMLDSDLAGIYGVKTKRLKEQVRRSLERFPEDFMFELTREERNNLRCQIGTSSLKPFENHGGARYLPMAFTGQGIAMLSSVLNSPQAIQTNIRIIRIFTQMRELMMSSKNLLLQLEEMKNKMNAQDVRIDQVFAYLAQFVKDRGDIDGRERIGFRTKK